MADNTPTIDQGAPQVVPAPQGRFRDSLKRTNKEIKNDRAESISEDTELAYERKVQDIRLQIKKLRRERENMLDLSPTNTHSLMLANEFDASEFIKRDINIGIELENLQITLAVAENRFAELFGRVI